MTGTVAGVTGGPVARGRPVVMSQVVRRFGALCQCAPEGGWESTVSRHGLTSIALGVPDVESVSRCYDEFGRRAAPQRGSQRREGRRL
jgi:hypothetical protein